MPEIASLICFVMLNEAGLIANIVLGKYTFDGNIVIFAVFVSISNVAYNLKRLLVSYTILYIYLVVRHYFILQDAYRFFRYSSYSLTALISIYILARLNV